MKHTYILGAGASCLALPMVSQLSKRIIKFIEELRNAIMSVVVESHNAPTYPEQFRPPPDGNYVEHLFAGLQHLRDVATTHFSVDTYARKLYIRREMNALKQLKTELSAYFLLEQQLRQADRRYDHFLATVLRIGESKPQFPDNVGILTWNYDAQLELSYYDYCRNIETVINDVTENANIVRLNGFCGATNQNDYTWTSRSVLTPFSLRDVEAFDAIIQKNQDPIPFERQNTVPSIRFAWELESEVLDKAQKILEGCENIIVIGYSFPSFNQKIDRALIANAPQLRHVFIQAPEADHAALFERATALVEAASPQAKTVQIKMLKATDQFYVPDDLILS